MGIYVCRRGYIPYVVANGGKSVKYETRGNSVSIGTNLAFQICRNSILGIHIAQTRETSGGKETADT